MLLRTGLISNMACFTTQLRKSADDTPAREGFPHPEINREKAVWMPVRLVDQEATLLGLPRRRTRAAAASISSNSTLSSQPMQASVML